MRLLLSDLAPPRGYLVAANCCHLGGFSWGPAGCVGMDTGGEEVGGLEGVARGWGGQMKLAADEITPKC